MSLDLVKRIRQLEQENRDAFRLIAALIMQYGDRDVEGNVTTVTIYPEALIEDYTVYRSEDPIDGGIKFGVRGVRDER